MSQLIDPQARQAVRVLLVEADPQIREGLRAALSQEGFRNLVTLSSLESVRDGFDNVDVDLLIIDTGARGADACDLIRKLRYSRKGRNPFVSVILTVHEDDTANVEKLLNSGTDHIIIKPIAPKMLFDRISALVDHRRLFVATSSYIGPDRRSEAKREGSGADIPVFAVPNTLKLKVEKQEVKPEDLQAAINIMLVRISAEMINRMAFQIVLQQRRVKEALVAKSDSLPVIKDLRAALDEFLRHVDPTTHAGTIDLATKLISKLTEISRAPQAVIPRDIELTEKLAMAIYTAFKGDEGDDALAAKITGALESFAKKAAHKKTGSSGLPPLT